eukprot:COSAG06_NODE_2653_length_6493_cov_24.617870_2_plen_64_part_00
MAGSRDFLFVFFAGRLGLGFGRGFGLCETVAKRFCFPSVFSFPTGVCPEPVLGIKACRHLIER